MPADPLVSVVVPFYGVEAYLVECLDSVLAQTWPHLDVVLVDDGSRDTSRAIADSYAARDPRLRVVERPNGGLGAARNTGLEHVRGDYVTFLDSDDTMPPTAVETLVRSALETGSDLVVGAPDRFDSTGHWPASWVAGVHAQRLRRTTLAAYPALLRNLYTWDKLFRRDFFVAQGLRFREGVSYEDQPVVTQLLARAAAIDVLPDVVYHYREREDRSSLSQQTRTLADLQDRIAAWDSSAEALREELAPELYDAWLGSLIDFHFVWYLAGSGLADDAYWAALSDAIRRLVGEAPERSWDRASPVRRVLTTLALQGRRDDVATFLDRGGRKLRRWRSVVKPQGVMLRLPFWGDEDIPRRRFLLLPEQLEVVHRLDDVRREDGALSLTGWAFLLKIDLAGREDHRVEIEVRTAAGEVHRVSAATGAPGGEPPVRDRHCDYGPGTFTAQVPPDLLGDAAELWLRVTTAGFTAAAPIHVRW